MYLRGRQAAADRNVAEAKPLYESAILLDDGLAEADGALGEALALEPTVGSSDDPSRRVRLKRAAERAYELAPDSPQSNLALALATDHLADRLNYLKKAIAIDGSYAEAYRQIGDQIADFDADRAVAFYRHALALDPRMLVSRAHIVDHSRRSWSRRRGETRARRRGELGASGLDDATPSRLRNGCASICGRR